MTAQKADGGPVGSRPTVLARPENLSEPRAAAVNVPSQRLYTCNSRTFQPYSRRSRITVWDIVVWSLVIFAMAAFLLGLCAAAWVVS